MSHFIRVETFDEWRERSRELLTSNTPPHDVNWDDGKHGPTLFDASPSPAASPEPPLSAKTHSIQVPPQFLQLARRVACHRDSGKWELLYRALWRITHGERHLLQISSDDDVLRLEMMEKAISRDAHKTKAFVRFRKVDASEFSGDHREELSAGEENMHHDESSEHFIAWHRPDHLVLRIVAPFFSRRFSSMYWTILTPDESVTWNLKELVYGPGVPSNEAPEPDALEDLWKTYYAHIFNPARIKLEMMKSEMPVRHWPTLPETEIIPEMLAKAPQRVEEMIRRQEGYARSAADFMPKVFEWDGLAKAAASCEACDLHRGATQTVFGRGPRDAHIVLIGEQPGDQEDLGGQPFIGPAGTVLNECIEAAGLNRDAVYLTNTVKHFKYTVQPRGKRRLHKKPDAREIAACRPWLEAELSLIRPRVVVCLGVTAARAIIGPGFRFAHQRGELQQTEWSDFTLATFHPSAALRAPSADRRQEIVSTITKHLEIARIVSHRD